MSHQVQVSGGEVLEGEHILIAAGSVPAKPPIPGSDLPGVLDSDALLASDTLYKRLVIIGGRCHRRGICHGVCFIRLPR